MRTVFYQKLAALTAAIGEMCALAGHGALAATQALLEADVSLAKDVVDDCENIVLQAARTEQDAFALLALQAPVAGDLRAVVASLKDVADVKRMGALVLHVTEIVRLRHPVPAVPEELKGCFCEMGGVAVELGDIAKEVVLSGDADKAAELHSRDDVMDGLHRELLSCVMDQQWRHGVAAAVNVALLGRYYERFADHAVDIGHRVLFRTTGIAPEDSIRKACTGVRSESADGDGRLGPLMGS